MISIDITEAEVRKFLTSESVKLLNKFLAEENVIVGVARMIYINHEDIFVTVDLFKNEINKSKMIFTVKGKIKLYDFRVQMLKELNKIGLVNKGEVKK